MQIAKEAYDEEMHDRYKAICLPQPWADKLVTPAFVKDGKAVAELNIMLRDTTVSYRGDILICSAIKPDVPGFDCGFTLGLVELYDIRKADALTDYERSFAFGPQDRCKAWMLRNPRRVIEMPIEGGRGLFDLVVPKDDIMAYPTALKIDEKDWRIIKNKILLQCKNSK